MVNVFSFIGVTVMEGCVELPFLYCFNINGPVKILSITDSFPKNVI